MKRILIDGRFIGVGESISRYTLEIVQGILELDKENEYTLLIRPQGEKIAKQFLSGHPERSEGSRDSSPSAQNDNNNGHKNFRTEILDIPHYSIQEQTKLLDYLNHEKFDLVHFTQFNHPIRYKGKYVITIHDLTLLGHLYRMNILKRWGFRKVMKSAVNDSTKIITVSETTKKDLAETYRVDPKKIEVTYLGVDGAYNAQVKSDPTSPGLRGAGKLKVESFKEKYHIGENYILYTGMWKRHKNILRMLQAFERFKTEELKNLRTKEQKGSHPRPDRGSTTVDSRRSLSRTTIRGGNDNIQLVLVGKIDREEPEVLREIERINNLTMKQFNNEAIVCTGFVDEAELPIAYAGATAYIIPSLSEGFGLPPLEAMACGTPILSSNISAMPEILGKAPFYFDPYNIEDMSMAIKTVIEDAKLQKELSEKGLEQVKLYDWSKTAKETLDVYKSVLK